MWFLGLALPICKKKKKKKKRKEKEKERKRKKKKEERSLFCLLLKKFVFGGFQKGKIINEINQFFFF